MRGAGVLVGMARDLEEGQKVKEAVKNFFLSGTRGGSGNVCGVCLKGRSSVELGEEVVGVVLQALLLVPPERETKVSSLWMCAECANSFNALNDLHLQLDELRCQFNDLRRIIGKQVILGSLGRSEKEWEGWEEESRGVEDMFPSVLLQREEKLFEKELQSVCGILLGNEFEIHDDIKLKKMTPVVILERLEETTLKSASLESPIRHLRKRRHVDFTETEGHTEEEIEEDFVVPSGASEVDSDDAESVEEDFSLEEEGDEIVKDKSGRFSCPRCKKTLCTKSSVQRHIAEVHDRQKSCSVCHRFFIRQTDLIRHQVKVHSIFPPEMTAEISCSHCDSTFTDTSTLNKHKLKRHLLGSTSAGDLQCLFCLKFFPDKTSLRQHQRKAHYGGRPPPPTEKVTDTEEEGHSPQNIRCFLCKTAQSPLTPEELKTHEESAEHTAKIRAKSSAFCDVCRLNFAWDLELLGVHLKSPEHKKEIDNLGEFDATTFCIPCRRNFKRSNLLQSHCASPQHAQVCVFREKEETAEDSQIKKLCPSCPKTFNLQSLLELHVLRNHAPSGHPCTLCSLSFTHRKELVSHQRRSHKNKVSSPKKCPHCDASFKLPRYLRKHLYYSHPKQTLLHKPHPCLFCFHTFSSTEELEDHTNKSHAHLKCPTCGKVCRDGFIYKRHIRGHTKNATNS